MCWILFFQRILNRYFDLLVCTDNVQTRVRWWSDGNLLADSGEPRHEPSERIRMYSNRSLEVSQVKRSDTGEYVCQASRPAPWGHATQVHEIEVMCEYFGIQMKCGTFADWQRFPPRSYRNINGALPLAPLFKTFRRTFNYFFPVHHNHN